MEDDLERLKIVELDLINIDDINKMNNAFEIKSRIVPHIKDGEFGYTLEEVPYA